MLERSEAYCESTNTTTIDLAILVILDSKDSSIGVSGEVAR